MDNVCRLPGLKQCIPKDIYPHLNTDKLVNFTSGHELLSIMDDFSSYHKTALSKEDQEQMAFSVNTSLYRYNVMTFSLKNVGATYQRLVNKIFAALIG